MLPHQHKHIVCVCVGLVVQCYIALQLQVVHSNAACWFPSLCAQITKRSGELSDPYDGVIISICPRGVFVRVLPSEQLCYLRHIDISHIANDYIDNLQKLCSVFKLGDKIKVCASMDCPLPPFTCVPRF